MKSLLLYSLLKSSLASVCSLYPNHEKTSEFVTCKKLCLYRLIFTFKLSSNINIKHHPPGCNWDPRPPLEWLSSEPRSWASAVVLQCCMCRRQCPDMQYLCRTNWNVSNWPLSQPAQCTRRTRLSVIMFEIIIILSQPPCTSTISVRQPPGHKPTVTGHRAFYPSGIFDYVYSASAALTSYSPFVSLHTDLENLINI